MKLFDLVFIAAFLLLLGSLIWAAVLRIRGLRDRAARLLRRLGAFVLVYVTADVVVSLVSPQTVLATGETRRFDDWCIAITGANRVNHVGAVSSGRDQFVIVTMRVFSEARRISQAAPHASIHLLDADGTRYDVDETAQAAYEQEHGTQPSLGNRLEPLGSFLTTRVFRVPAAIDHVDVVTPHGGGPGAFIIGDDNSFFHKPTVVRVPLN